VDPTAWQWTDQDWMGKDLLGSVIYELHVGTFTPEGTLDSAISRLDHLAELGVDIVELMPLAAFPGRAGWGYDGVGLWAVHEAYGGPEALMRFVDAAHPDPLSQVAAVRTVLSEIPGALDVPELIVLNNHLTGLGEVPREAVEALVLMTAPVAPHIAEEIWKRLGHEHSLAHEDFPVVTDEALLAAEKVTCVIQVKGKVRDRLEVDPDISEAELEKLALEAPGGERDWRLTALVDLAECDREGRAVVHLLSVGPQQG